MELSTDQAMNTPSARSPAFFFVLQALTGFLLTAELVRLTAPAEFLWVFESSLWTEGGYLLALVGAGMAALAILFPPALRFLCHQFPPLLVVAGMLVNLAWMGSLAWWMILAAGLAWWVVWLIEARIARAGRPAVVIIGGMNFLVLLFLYLDAHFFRVTNTHLNLMHLWFLQFSGIIAAAAISPATQLTLAKTSAGFVFITVGLGRLLREHLASPPSCFRRVGLAAFLLVLHFLQFPHLAERQPIPSYLNFRLQFGASFLPEPARFREPAFTRAQALLPVVDLDRAYRLGKLAWTAPSGFDLVIILVESWRADLFPDAMPLLKRRVEGRGTWLRNHFAQANSTPAALIALFHGIYPFEFLSRYARLPNPPFYRLFQDRGYQLHYVFGSPFDDVMAFNPGFQCHHPDDPTAPWPDQALDGLRKTAGLLERPGRKLVHCYLYSTHFDYRYPPEFERAKPTLPEGSDILSLNPTPEAILGVTNRYKNALGFLDAAFEEFFTRIDRSGAASRTVFVLVGDHGESLGEAGFFAHATGPHLSQFQVPCLIFAPGLPPRVIDHSSQHLDLLPTLGTIMGFQAVGMAGTDALRTTGATGSSTLQIDFSAQERLIVRTPGHMGLYDLDSAGRLSWVLTLRNDFSLDAPLYYGYASPGSRVLPALIEEDAAVLRERLGDAAGPLPTPFPRSP